MTSSSTLLLNSVRSSLFQRCQLPRGARVLVAWSGGPDSTALVWALQQLAAEGLLEIETAHIDHGLRANSADEARDIQTWAARWNIPVHVRRLALDGGQSGVQARAREARYRALFGLARDLACPWIATGHNWNDQAETVLMRILRGAQVRGLRGILPRTEDGRIRPLLTTARSVLYRALQEQDLPFLEDPTNQSPKYLRSRIRHTLLPELRLAEPLIDQRLVQIADDAFERWALIAPELKNIAPGTALPVDQLMALPKQAWGAALSIWLDAPFEQKNVRAISTLVDKAQTLARVSAPGGHTVHRVAGFLVAGPRVGEADYAKAFRPIISLGRFISNLPSPTTPTATQWRLAHDGVKQRWKDRLRRLGVPEALRPIWPVLWSGGAPLGLLGEAKISKIVGIEPPVTLFNRSRQG